MNIPGRIIKYLIFTEEKGKIPDKGLPVFLGWTDYYLCQVTIAE